MASRSDALSSEVPKHGNDVSTSLCYIFPRGTFFVDHLHFVGQISDLICDGR